MPSKDRLKQGVTDAMERRKAQLCQYLSGNSNEIVGMVGVRKLKEKKRSLDHKTQATEYVKNFSRAADANLGQLVKQGQGSASFALANMLKEKMAVNQAKQKEADSKTVEAIKL